MGWRLKRGLSLAAVLQLEAARRNARRLTLQETQAQLDSLLVQHAELRNLFNQAMMRVGELELLREIAKKPPWPVRLWRRFIRTADPHPQIRLHNR